MPKYRITGDICHSGVVTVEFDSEDDLAETMLVDDKGGTGIYVDAFEIEDEQQADAFRWDGGEIELVEEEA